MADSQSLTSGVMTPASPGVKHFKRRVGGTGGKGGLGGLGGKGATKRALAGLGVSRARD